MSHQANKQTIKQCVATNVCTCALLHVFVLVMYWEHVPWGIVSCLLAVLAFVMAWCYSEVVPASLSL